MSWESLSPSLTVRVSEKLFTGLDIIGIVGIVGIIWALWVGIVFIVGIVGILGWHSWSRRSLSLLESLAARFGFV